MNNQNNFAAFCNNDPQELSKGYDFNQGINFQNIFKSFLTTGNQATNFNEAVNIINQMIEMKKIPLPEDELISYFNPVNRIKTNCTIFLGYASNIVTSGVREVIKYLAEHNLVDVIVTAAGGIEEDFVKCLNPSYIGSFRDYNDSNIYENKCYHIGNVIIPTNNYDCFKKWLMPIIIKMHEEQIANKIIWTPSSVVSRLGKEINNEDSIYYWCSKNNIPVFCPGFSDGFIGDIFADYSELHPDFVIDTALDIVVMNKQATTAKHSGMIILGGGVPKHHIANANLMRNGADYSVYINTGNEWEASDSGAPPEEAISWGKIKSTSKQVKLQSEISLVFPLIVALTFAKHVESKKQICG